MGVVPNAQSLTRSYRRDIVWMVSIVNNKFVEANSRPELVLQQIDFVEETGCTAKGSAKGRVLGEKRVAYRISWMFSRSLELQTCFQMSRLSSSRFTFGSSARRWSKQLTGARKMIELMLSK